MTISDKIIQLNTEFQKLYYDNDLAFFKKIVPEKLSEIKDFFVSVIDDHHPLSHKTKELCRLIDKEMNEIKEFQKTTNASFRLKDHVINTAKRNVSELLWTFHRNIWNYDEKILKQNF